MRVSIMPYTGPTVRIRSQHRQSSSFVLFCQSLATIVDLPRRRPARPAVLRLDRAKRPEKTVETRRTFQRESDPGCPAPRPHHHFEPAAASPARGAAPVPSLAKSSRPSIGTRRFGKDRSSLLPLLRGIARTTAGRDCDDRWNWQLRATASAISGSQWVLPSLTIRIIDPSLVVLPLTDPFASVWISSDNMLRIFDPKARSSTRERGPAGPELLLPASKCLMPHDPSLSTSNLNEGIERLAGRLQIAAS